MCTPCVTGEAVCGVVQAAFDSVLTEAMDLVYTLSPDSLATLQQVFDGYQRGGCLSPCPVVAPHMNQVGSHVLHRFEGWKTATVEVDKTYVCWQGLLFPLACLTCHHHTLLVLFCCVVVLFAEAPWMRVGASCAALTWSLMSTPACASRRRRLRVAVKRQHSSFKRLRAQKQRGHSMHSLAHA